MAAQMCASLALLAPGHPRQVVVAGRAASPEFQALVDAAFASHAPDKVRGGGGMCVCVHWQARRLRARRLFSVTARVVLMNLYMCVCVFWGGIRGGACTVLQTAVRAPGTLRRGDRRCWTDLQVVAQLDLANEGRMRWWRAHNPEAVALAEHSGMTADDPATAFVCQNFTCQRWVDAGAPCRLCCALLAMDCVA